MVRDKKLDGLKFIMIFLVVLGHIGYNDWGVHVNRLIYSFHMPVFIFLSGYFTIQNTSEEKQMRWLKQTFLIYIVAQLVNFVLTIGLELIPALVRHEAFDTSMITWNILIAPRFALWYLVCLIYWRLAVWQVFSRSNDFNLLYISCLLAIVSGIIPIDESFAFQRTFAFFPFFVSGMLFRKRNLMSELEKIPYTYAFGGLLIGLLIARYLPTYMPKFHYTAWHDPILRVVQGSLGLYLSLLIIRLSRVDFVERFAIYGGYTLWIYIGHTYLIIIGRKAFPFFGITFNLMTATLLACVYCMLCICLAKVYNSKIAIA